MRKPKKPEIITALGRGKVWYKSLAAAEKRVLDLEEYFIKRDGAWFRAKAQGYTIELGEAGVFLGKEARGYLPAEGVSLVPVSMMLGRIRKEVGEHLAKAARLSEMVDRN